MKPYKIAIAGLGTVGASVIRILQENNASIIARAARPIEVVAVSARDKSRQRNCDLGGALWVDNPLDLAAIEGIDAVVELIGGADGAAYDLCRAALARGVSVVTANKALLAKHGAELAANAEKANAQLFFEAAVAGGIPVIKTVREGLSANHFTVIEGILNGTCNYILTRMAEDGLEFSAALQLAQNQGYAEADPTADIDGHDTAHKLSILAALAFGVRPDVAAVSLEGIRRVSALDLRFAAELKCSIKLLGVARLSAYGLEQRVSPCLVPLASPLGKVNGVLNGVLLRGDAVGGVTLVGRGAGGNPTASAVLGDIIDLARGHKMPPFSVPAGHLKLLQAVPLSHRASCWYLRLQVKDQPGVVADIAALLRDENISIEKLLQHGRSHTTDGPVSVVITTHEINESAIRKATQQIGQLQAVCEEPCLIRLENTEK